MASRTGIGLRVKVGTLRGLLLEERFTTYQLVGEVTAHQGDDG